jgi:hypothetical protein
MKWFALFLMVLFFKAGTAQIEVQNPELYVKLKQSILYVQIGDTTTDLAMEMMQQIKSVWTYSKIEFVSIGDDKSLLQPGNFFATVEDNAKKDYNFMYTNRMLMSENFSSVRKYVGHYTFINFWVMKEGKGKDEELTDKYRSSFARAELHPLYYYGISIDYSNLNMGSRAFQGSFFNNLPGFIKNTFQDINFYLENNLTKKQHKDIEAKPGLSQLKTDTLFIANYWYGPELKNRLDNRDGSTTKKVEKMLQEYGKPIKMVSRQTLNHMILTAKKSFYYCNFVQQYTDKMISVVNGLTGEILYYDVSRNYKDFLIDDGLKKISKAVDRL